MVVVAAACSRVPQSPPPPAVVRLPSGVTGTMGEEHTSAEPCRLELFHEVAFEGYKMEVACNTDWPPFVNRSFWKSLR